MNCVVINLAEQSERWQSTRSQFDQWQIPVRRFEAVNVLQLEAEPLRRWYSPELNRQRYHQPLVRTEIACYASHRQLWQALLESEEPGLAIFEDDVQIQSGLPEILRAAGQLPGPWGIVKLIGRTREHVRRRCPWISGSDLIEYARIPSLCSAYVISRQGARQLLARSAQIARPVDVDIRSWWESGCQVFGVQPYPVTLSPLSRKSTIGDRTAPRGLAHSIRRWRQKMTYHWGNWRSRRSQTDTPWTEWQRVRRRGPVQRPPPHPAGETATAAHPPI